MLNFFMKGHQKGVLTMASKLDRIEKDIQKTKSKIAEYQKQLRELEAQKTEQENLQIIQLVRGMNMKPEEFAAFLRSGAMLSIPIEISILFGNSEHPFPERKNMPFRSRVQLFI